MDGDIRYPITDLNHLLTSTSLVARTRELLPQRRFTGKLPAPYFEPEVRYSRLINASDILVVIRFIDVDTTVNFPRIPTSERTPSSSPSPQTEWQSIAMVLVHSPRKNTLQLPPKIPLEVPERPAAGSQPTPDPDDVPKRLCCFPWTVGNHSINPHQRSDFG